jgi:hypothetical protein
MGDNGQAHTTLAAFTVDNGDAARRLLTAVQRVDASAGSASTRRPIAAR